MALNRFNYSFIGLLLFHTTILLFIANDFSISYKESLNYFDTSSVLYYITHAFTYVLGNDNFTVRLPFILFYIGSSILFYLLTEDYFKYQWDRILALSIFMVLPGVNSSALLINESIIVIFSTLLFLYIYNKTGKENYPLLFLFLFIDNSFAILFLALFVYALTQKDNKLLIVSLLLFGLSMSIYGFELGGRPRGYFFDTFGIYATIFSPILVFYFFYSIYRVGIHFTKDIIWYITITALSLSFLFSLRQKIDITDFAPFVVIAVPIMVKLFMHSIRVKLKEFRKIQYSIAFLSLLVLGLNFLLFVFNKQLYLILDNPSKHFMYKYHNTQELANKLKQLNIVKLSTNDKKLQQKLKFYKISQGNDYYLTTKKIIDAYKIIDINYGYKTISKFYIIQK